MPLNQSHSEAGMALWGVISLHINDSEPMKFNLNLKSEVL